MRKLNVNANHDRAREIHETAMEVIHGYVEDAIDGIEKLGVLVDRLSEECDRDKADELISKILTSLEKI